MTNGPRASTLLYYHPISDPRGYSEEVALRETCCGLADLCDDYLNPDYGVRPVDDCSNYVPPVWSKLPASMKYPSLHHFLYSFL